MNNEFTTRRIIDLSAMCLSILTAVIIFIWGLLAFGRVYDVWGQGKAGQAELAKAEFNRQIKTLEAKAIMESAKNLAEAEIIRAEGVAKANKIIGNSLQENEGYLRYLWIQNLHEKEKTVVYIPTEANLPLLEANRLRN